MPFLAGHRAHPGPSSRQPSAAPVAQAFFGSESRDVHWDLSGEDPASAPSARLGAGPPWKGGPQSASVFSVESDPFQAAASSARLRPKRGALKKRVFCLPPSLLASRCLAARGARRGGLPLCEKQCEAPVPPSAPEQPTTVASQTMRAGD